MNFNDYQIVILQGISGSGKSTYARELVAQSQEPWTIVSRDEIRKRYMNSEELNNYFSNHLDTCFEEFITTIEHQEIASTLSSGRRVIIDNTNLRKKYVVEYIKIAIDLDIPREKIIIVRMPDVTTDEALERIQGRSERFIDWAVLQRQESTFEGINWTLDDCFESLRDYRPKQWFLPKFYVEPYVPDKTKPLAIICDIDGTLAHRALIKEPYPHLRSFFDYPACQTDEVDPLVSLINAGVKQFGCQLIFLSGRKRECELETRQFICRACHLDDLYSDEFHLFMRDPRIDAHDGKDDPDDIVKYRIFNEEIRHRFNVIGAIDDRKRVLALWEALGIKTINVGKLNEVF